ncbi:MAG TPA: ribose 5-phosphate isomerase A [Acetobacteraceae bacterium]|jgi:ribose 5-phosphate isomerase A
MDRSSDTGALKRAAAEAAAALVESGMAVGLGTGSTAAFAIAALIRRTRQEGLNFVAIPTSERSAIQAREGGLRLTEFSHHHRLDLSIDGADEIARGSLHLVKGAGGALLREKIVAAASDRLVIIADESKLVDQLGLTARVPVEVAVFGWETTADRLARMVEPRLRMRADGTAFRTDGGNYILDCACGAIADPAALQCALVQTVGVVDTGLFVGMADVAFVAGRGGVVRLERAHDAATA